MSKAFTRDDDWQEPVVAPRAPLPQGVPNLVTPRGLARLREELAELDAARQRLEAECSHDDDETEHRRRQAILGKRLGDLTERIASAQLVEPDRQSNDKVRFGAAVTLEARSGARIGEVRRLEIVGVDEADPKTCRIAFTAPIARVLLGLEVGEVASLETAEGEELLEILRIETP